MGRKNQARGTTQYKKPKRLEQKFHHNLLRRGEVIYGSGPPRKTEVSDYTDPRKIRVENVRGVEFDPSMVSGLPAIVYRVFLSIFKGRKR